MASYFFKKNGRSQASPSPVAGLDEGLVLDSSSEVFGQTPSPDTSMLGVTLSPITKTPGGANHGDGNTSLGASFRSPQVILDSDESSSEGDPKDLHRDLLEDHR